MTLVRYMQLSLFLLAVASVATSCNQKELDYPGGGSRYHIELSATYDKLWYLLYEDGVDWLANWDDAGFMMTYDSLMPTIPDGLRVVAYDERDNIYDIYNLPPDGGLLDLAPGHYSLTLFNNDTQYIVFNDLDKSVGATATTSRRTRSPYGPTTSADPSGLPTINPPDMLYACNGGHVECSAQTEDMLIECQMRPLVYKYLVRYHFTHGLQHVEAAVGAMSGMAASVYLTDGHTPEAKATIMYDIDLDACQVRTNSDTGEGLLYAVVNTFGAPGMPNEYYSRGENDYALRLDATLTNGNVRSFNFDISRAIAMQPRGGVIEVFGLKINDEDAATQSGVFEVEVEDWGPHQDVDLF